MCNCISDLETKILKMVQDDPGRYKKPVDSISMKGIGYPIVGGKMLVKTLNNVEITLIGQKKKESLSMFHTYCPFCGTKYSNE